MSSPTQQMANGEPAPALWRTPRRGLWICTAIIAGCASDPGLLRVVDRVFDDGTFSTTDVELVTLSDLETVTGEVVQTIGDAVLDIATAPAVDGGAARSEIVRGGSPVRARWLTDGDVAVPIDFDSLAMFTTYAHLETASRFFSELGVASASTQVPVYYNPTVPGAEELGLPSADNAAFFPNADAFLLLPMVVLQEIPFSMNPGVLAHEYAHRVFYFEAWGGRMFEILLAAVDQRNFYGVWNLLRALDEGIADYYGAMIADDPRFLSHSVFPEAADPRDLTETRVLSTAWLGGAEPTTDGETYNPYAVGAVVGSILWAFAEVSGREPVHHAVLTAQRQLASALSSQFAYAVGDFETAVIETLPSADRSALCARAAATYAPAGISFAGSCP